MFNKFKTKIEIFRRFLPVLWNLTWYDYSSLLELQLAQLKFMEDHWVKDTYHVGDFKVKKDIATARMLTRRLLDDDYSTTSWRLETAKLFNEEFKITPYDHCESQRNQDLNMLYSKLFQKKLHHWWD